MIIFLYGPDTYRSNKKLKEIIARYKEIHKSGMSFHVLRRDANTFDDFRNAVYTTPMFKEKKLVVSKNFLGSGDFVEKFILWKGKDSLKNEEEVVCVFHEEIIDRKDRVFVWLAKNAQFQKFDVLKGAQLQKWAQQFIKKAGIKIEQEALNQLLAYTGGDLWAFENEIQKLKSYKEGIVTCEDLAVFVRPPSQTHIFSLVDAFVEGDKHKAIKFLNAHIESGDNEQYLFYMIHNQFRNIAQARDFLERNEYNIYKIANSTGMHPYAAKKSMAQAKHYSREEIKKIYNKVVDLEVDIKTGKVDPRAGLENLIFFNPLSRTS